VHVSDSKLRKVVLDRVVAAHNKALRSGEKGTSTASLHIHWPDRKVEIVTNKLAPKAPYHYVVESHGCEVLSWGKSANEEIKSAGKLSR
jgi:hypothetical protein